MINIYYGRENVNKERFVFENIMKADRETIVIVPDQYTLECEKQAFRYTGKKSIIKTRILSLSRLGETLANSIEKPEATVITKIGRQMLLADIMKKNKDNLKVFSGLAEKTDFVSSIDDFISSAKQFSLTPEYFYSQFEREKGESQLKDKLHDLHLIYSEYEKRIAGRFIDLEYLMNYYSQLIEKADFLKEQTVWIYGFDSFTPKNFEMLSRLCDVCEDVNFVITHDYDENHKSLFELSGIVIESIKEMGASIGSQVKVSKIPVDYLCKDKAKGIQEIEQSLFALIKPEIDETDEKRSEGIVLTECANVYNEVESAAAFINYLTREKGLSFNDIAVIDNDTATRENVIGRIFDEYDIDVFQDKKRKIINSPFVIFILALIDAASKGYRTPDILKIVKSGFASASRNEAEILENYGIVFKIKGSMWKNPAPDVERYGVAYKAEEVEEIRARVISQIEQLEEIIKGSKTNSDFFKELYKLLVEDFKVEKKLESLAKEQIEHEDLDGARETEQLWNKTITIFDQIVELVGEEPMDISSISSMLAIGFSSVEIGIIPPTSDAVIVGTTQRTRLGQAKAVIVIGANEGILPSGSKEDVLFSREELELFGDDTEGQVQIESIQNKQKVMQMEEMLGIYRTLSLPTDYLWISYSKSDAEGKELRASEILTDVANLLKINVEIDPISCDNVEKYIGGEINTLRHLGMNLQQHKRGIEINPKWLYIDKWFEENSNSPEYKKVHRVVSADKYQTRLPKNLVESLYTKRDESQNDGVSYSLSPSRIERFSKCPFSHFVNYGLRPVERRIFEAGSLEIGDVFHAVLMEVSKRVCEDEGEYNWREITREMNDALVKEVMAEITKHYGSGVFGKDNEEKYKSQRAIDQLQMASWYLINQMRHGDIKESRFEEKFGRSDKGAEIPPIVKEFEEGTVYIEGIIDRIDYLTDERKIKIIDYKTGREKFDIAEAAKGYRLQLMLYLKAAQSETYQPAGVFYFLLGDNRMDVKGNINSANEEKLNEELMKNYKLDGIMVDDDSVINAIDNAFEKTSLVAPLRRTKEGVKGTAAGKLLSAEEFSALQDAIDEKLDEICGDLVKGKIDISPMKSGNSSACDFCKYKSICNFDLDFVGCDYRNV